MIWYGFNNYAFEINRCEKRENLDISRACKLKLWIIFSDFKPNNLRIENSIKNLIRHVTQN